MVSASNALGRSNAFTRNPAASSSRFSERRIEGSSSTTITVAGLSGLNRFDLGVIDFRVFARCLFALAVNVAPAYLSRICGFVRNGPTLTILSFAPVALLLDQGPIYRYVADAQTGPCASRPARELDAERNTARGGRFDESRICSASRRRSALRRAHVGMRANGRK